MQREITTIFGSGKAILCDTKRAITPYGGLAVFVEYLVKIRYSEAIRRYMPVHLTSRNAIAPEETYTAFLISVLCGARRFAQSGLMRLDKALHSILGIERFPTDDTIMNLFRRFTQGKVTTFYEGLAKWQVERLPERQAGYSLDLDSTVFERYGKQEGALKGYNPKKPGRASHHPLLAVLSEAHFFLHGWLRSGNCSSSRGVVEFVREALALLNGCHAIRLVRADGGFCDDKFFRFLEENDLPYVVTARLTRWVKSELHCIKEWKELDDVHSVAEFNLKLCGWKRDRHFAVVREQVQDKPSLGKRLIDIPEYTFRVFVTSLSLPPEEVWREYNKRADMEKRIGELKYDLAADDFCMRGFFHTEAAFRGILFLFNLLSEFQRVAGMTTYRQPATLRSGVFLCGAVMGSIGRHVALHLSSGWGGLQTRNHLFDNILAYVFPASPKLAPVASDD